MTDVAPLSKLLVEALDSYNEINAAMNLVSGARAGSSGVGRDEGGVSAR